MIVRNILRNASILRARGGSSYMRQCQWEMLMYSPRTRR